MPPDPSSARSPARGGRTSSALAHALVGRAPAGVSPGAPAGAPGGVSGGAPAGAPAGASGGVSADASGGVPLAPGPSPSTTARAIGELADRQLELAEQLDRLSLAQRELIAVGDTERLLATLTQRGELIEQLLALAEHARTLNDDWHTAAAGLDPAVRDDLRHRLDTAAEVIGAVLDRDADDRAELERRRDELAGQLSGVQRNRAAVSAYGGPRPSGARLHDRTG